MREVMCFIMKGEASPIQLSAFLIGMRMKGETIEELTTAFKYCKSL
jgi:anthranilate phosphoribosyltransferase